MTPNFLGRLTMYRLTSYCLLMLAIAAAFLCCLGFLAFNPVAFVFSGLYIYTICLITDVIFAWAYDQKTNLDSVFISAMILLLIITPLGTVNDLFFFSLALL